MRTQRIDDASGDLLRVVAFDAWGRVVQSGPRGPQKDFDDLSTAPNTTRYRDFVTDFESAFTYGSDDVARITYFEGARASEVVTGDTPDPIGEVPFKESHSDDTGLAARNPKALCEKPESPNAA